MQIQHLLDAYVQSEPKRAHGGIYAMAGFDFQAQMAIARFVQSMVATDGLDQAGMVFVEALSDVAEVTENKGLVLLQVKRTLTGASLNDAATEMAAIEAVANRQQPPIEPTYGIVCQYADVELNWDKLPAKSPHQVLVKRLLDEGRLKQPELHQDPRWAAIAAAWLVLKDPWAFYRFAFERILRRTVDSADVERCRDEISERFAQDRRHSTPPGQLLLPCDFEIRSAQADSRLDIGQQVNLKRWQAGKYMTRTALAAGLTHTANMLRQGAEANPSSVMSVLWLAGRSGAGKSVMLLNLLSVLVQQGKRVWWLKPEELEAAIGLLARNDALLMPDFIAVDDVFDRDARDRLNIVGISILIDEQGVRDWPVLLTCGPSEFAADFEEATRYQGFEVCQHVLPLLDVQEGQQFVDWLRQRGVNLTDTSEALRQTEHGEGLFVSVATELAYGDLRQFGMRFAQRVRAHGKEFVQGMRLCLALNRLYLRAPADWLTPQQREDLEDMNRDGDFALELTESAQESLRLTHPHLSDAIYPHLLQAGSGVAFAEDLGAAFTKALSAGKEPLVLRLLLAFSPTDTGALAERMKRVDSARLAKHCVNAWRKHVSGGDIRVQAGLKVAWANWAVAHPFLNKSLDVLLSEALTDMQAAEAQLPGLGWWPAWWMRLWRAHEGNSKLAVWAVQRLKVDQATDLAAWSRIWQLVFSLQLSGHHGELLVAAQRWLARSGHRGDWHFVWRDLKSAGSLPDQQIIDLLNWALPCTDAPHWAHVWQESLSAPPVTTDLEKLLAQGCEWLKGRQDKDQWAFVWRVLLERERDLPQGQTAKALVEQGCAWLKGREDKDQWNFVWRVLLERERDLPQGQTAKALVEQGCEWLKGRQDKDQWAFVWQVLLERECDLPQGQTVKALVEQGCAWLKGREDKDQWSYVWRVLLERERDLPQGQTAKALVEQGYAWLKGREDKDQWAFAWLVLMERERDLPQGPEWDELLMVGVDWAQRHVANPSSPVILKAALKHWGGLSLEVKADLGALVAQWAPRCAEFEVGPAGHLIEAMIDAGLGSDAAIQRAAREWCERASSHPSWPLFLIKSLRCASVLDGWSSLAQRLARQVAYHPNAGWLHKAEQLLTDLRPEDVTSGVSELLIEVRQRKLAQQWKQVNEWLASDEAVPASISAVNNRGSIVELPGGMYAVLPKVSTIQYQPGQIVQVKVVRVEVAKDRVTVCEPGLSVGLPPAGNQVMCRITGHKPYGIFVMVGYFSGLIRANELPLDKDAWPRWLPLMSEWYVKILSHTDKGFNAALVEPPWPNA